MAHTRLTWHEVVCARVGDSACQREKNMPPHALHSIAVHPYHPINVEVGPVLGYDVSNILLRDILADHRL
jgi:hypothetical protein